MDPEPSTTAQPPERVTEPPAAPRWGLGDWLAGLLAGYALTSLVAALWFAVSGDEELHPAGQALSQIGLWAGMVGAAVFASRSKGTGRLGDDFGFRFRWSDVGLGLAVAVAMQLFVLPALGFLLQPLLGEPEVSEPVRQRIAESRGPGYVALLLLVAVGAPIVEELFFRGLLLRSLQRRFRNGWAIALAGVAFGVAHVNPLPLNGILLVMISLAVFGAVLAALAIRTGRLGAGIVAHGVFNLVTIVYLTLNPG